MQVPSLDGEDPLEEGRATHSSTLPWEIPWTEEPGGPQCMGSQRVGHDRVTNTCLAMKQGGSWLPDQGLSPQFLHWEPGFSTGPPGKSWGRAFRSEHLCRAVSGRQHYAALHAREVRKAGKQPPCPSLLRCLPRV